MANHRMEPVPSARMVGLLAEQREWGATFDEAWREAWNEFGRRGDDYGLPYEVRDRQEWEGALRRAKEEFRAAYEGRPTPLMELMELLENEGVGA